MKTEQLIPLCRRYHAMLLHSDEQYNLYCGG